MHSTGFNPNASSSPEQLGKFMPSVNDSNLTEPSLKTRLAFQTWRALLVISLATFALGLSGHVVTILAAPWLPLKTQAAIHATIPVLLTAVKFITVPLLVLLTPFAHRHPTFQAWEHWGKIYMKKIEAAAAVPWNVAKALFNKVKSFFR